MTGFDRRSFGNESAAPSPDSAAAMAEAVAHLQGGRRAETVAICERVLAREPDNPDALHMLGGMAMQEGDCQRAVELIGRAAALDPSRAARFLDLAAAQSGLGQEEAAAESFQRVLALQPGHVLALHSLGQIHHRRGGFAAAIECYRGALAVEPGRAPLHKGLGDSLRASGQVTEAADAYRRALAIEPNDKSLLVELGNLERPRDSQAALDCSHRAAELEPSDAVTFNLIGVVHAERGEGEAAATAYRHAIALRPDLIGPRVNLARLQIATGEAAAALDAAEGALQVNPFFAGALGVKGIALHELGRAAESDALFDYDRFVQTRRLVPPPGYEDMAAFNAALAEAVRCHPSLVNEIPELATRGGLQTREMFNDGEPVATLRHMISAAVDDYIAALPVDPGHPFTASRRQSYKMTGWGVVLGNQGRQEAHMHDNGWISGVYYVALPPGCGESAVEKSGWLEFGRCNEVFKLDRPPRLHAVQPEEGLLVLFPSFFWHGTVPFESAQPRISIAFDAFDFA